jgi:5-formyltetrahydrofolate cyclo-ligase
MTEKKNIRNKVWAKLRSVACPDSLFHWDFSAFIPDFGGSDRCAIEICKPREYANADCIFITPDNSLTTVRKQAILDKKLIIVPTYGIQRGFWQIKPSEIPQRQKAFAATLDGLESFAHPYHMKRGEQLTKPDLLMTGA